MAQRIRMSISPRKPPAQWSPGDGWEVKKQTSARASKVTKTKEAAISWARSHANKNPGVYEIRVFDSDFNPQRTITV